MKKLIPLAIVLITSCVSKEKYDSYRREEFSQSYHVVIIDSCEYIFVPYGDASWGSHKGNCKYCKLRNDLHRKK